MVSGLVLEEVGTEKVGEWTVEDGVMSGRIEEGEVA